VPRSLPDDSLLRGPLAVPHGMTLRPGGVSAPPFDTLNLGASVGDDPAAVAENRRRVAAAFGVPEARVMLMSQVHGRVVRVPGVDPVGSQGDALVSDDPDFLLVVSAADCLPVVLHDPGSGAVAAVHAGWRGTAAGVSVAALEAMVRRFGTRARDVEAWFGAAIRGDCYQVGPEVVTAMRAAGAPAGTYWPDPAAPGRYRLDVPAVNRAQLEAAGVVPERITDSAVCTHCDPRCYSHRRDSGRTGRHWAVVRAGGDAADRG
jgi:polyphenol oxidase